jgi:hypothetical protein
LRLILPLAPVFLKLTEVAAESVPFVVIPLPALEVLTLIVVAAEAFPRVRRPLVEPLPLSVIDRGPVVAVMLPEKSVVPTVLTVTALP